jgi:hypothetical protein
VARSFQQQSLLRKIIYIVLIFVLATGTVLLRSSGPSSIDARASALEIREESLGDVELTGSAVRLMLTGSRGFAVLVLWSHAIEKQKKHEWNDLELTVKSVTKLQPHFITPWLFQSWNLAYNVSVESDLIRDKYFYIAEGISLLADGEKLNRNHPDLRFSMGFYNQHKIGISDEANTLRCLYQMSCIDPVRRDPNRLKRQDDPSSVDLVKFEQFCKDHPMLVRRMRELLKRDTPGDILDFLADNQRIPSMYEARPQPAVGGMAPQTDLLPVEKRFPVLPPSEYVPPVEASPRADPTSVDFDNFQVARDWYSYAQEPLPPADPVRSVLAPHDFDARKYRLPRFGINIFRSYPARGQAFVAEHLQKEGWFEKEGWRILGWFPDDKFEKDEDAVVGKDVDWSARAWSRTHEMYRTYGEKNGLYIRPEDEKSLNDEAKPFREWFHVPPNGPFPGGLPDEMRGNKEMEKSYLAHMRLNWSDRYRQQTNFPYFFYKSEVESDPNTVRLRKDIFEAEQLRKSGEREQALEKYRAILPVLRDLLVKHKEFGGQMNVQEDSYEIAMQARQVFLDLYGKRLRELLVLGDFLGQAANRPASPLPWCPSVIAARDYYLEVATALDGKTAEGASIIDISSKFQARSRMGLPPPLFEVERQLSAPERPRTLPED